MKISTDRAWILDRIFYLLIALVGFMNGWFSISTVLVLTVIQRTVHEFIHAIAVYLVGGTVLEIQLGPGNIQRINFETLPGIRQKIVFAAGVFFDTIITGIMAIILISTESLWIFPHEFFVIAGFFILAIMIYFHLVPEESDFNMMLQRERNK